MIWRLCKAKHAALDGEGSLRAGGRWNRPGTRVVYASETLSLAVLEALVHLDPDELPEDYVAISLVLPGGVEIKRIESSELPSDWRRIPAPPRLAVIGAGWIERGESAALSVPSVVIPGERNYVLNCRHKDFALIEAGKPAPFSFDPRLWRDR